MEGGEKECGEGQRCKALTTARCEGRVFRFIHSSPSLPTLPLPLRLPLRLSLTHSLSLSLSLSLFALFCI